MGLIAILMIFLVIFILSRYKTLGPDHFVIHLRRGLIRRVRIGGSAIILQTIDQIITFPTMKLVEFDGKRQSILKWIEDYGNTVPEELIEIIAKTITTDNWESYMVWIKIIFDKKLVKLDMIYT